MVFINNRCFPASEVTLEFQVIMNGQLVRLCRHKRLNTKAILGGEDLVRLFLTYFGVGFCRSSVTNEYSGGKGCLC